MRVPPHPSEPLTGTDVVTTMGQSPPSCLGASVAPAHAQVQHGGRGGGECTVPVPYQWPRRNFKLM